MPQYIITFKNVADPKNPLGWQQVERAQAPDLATVEAMVQRDAGRYVDLSLYTWTIQEITSQST